jgi:hypothetical protein
MSEVSLKGKVLAYLGKQIELEMKTPPMNSWLNSTPKTCKKTYKKLILDRLGEQTL